MQRHATQNRENGQTTNPAGPVWTDHINSLILNVQMALLGSKQPPGE
jgi:hypothetical protein